MNKDIKQKILDLANKGINIIQIKNHIDGTSYTEIEQVCNDSWRGKLEKLIN